MKFFSNGFYDNKGEGGYCQKFIVKFQNCLIYEFNFFINWISSQENFIFCLLSKHQIFLIINLDILKYHNLSFDI